METVVPQSPRGQPLERRGADRAAEATRVTETRIVGEDQQDVRRTVRRGQRRDVIPVRLRAVERPLHRALKRRTPDGQLGAVNSLVAHVPSLLLCRGCVCSLARSTSAIASQTLRLCWVW